MKEQETLNLNLLEKLLGTDIVRGEVFQKSLINILENRAGFTVADLNKAMLDGSNYKGDDDLLYTTDGQRFIKPQFDITYLIFTQNPNFEDESFEPFYITVQGAEFRRLTADDTIEICDKFTERKDGRKIVRLTLEEFRKAQNGSVISLMKDEESEFYDKEPARERILVGIISEHCDRCSDAAATMDAVIAKTGWDNSAESQNYIEIVKTLLESGKKKIVAAQNDLEMEVVNRKKGDWALTIKKNGSDIASVINTNSTMRNETQDGVVKVDSCTVAMHNIADSPEGRIISDIIYSPDFSLSGKAYIKYSKNENYIPKPKENTRETMSI